MTCFNPIECFMPADTDKEGKRRIIFNPQTINDYCLSSDYQKKYLPHSDYKLSLDNRHIVLDGTFTGTGLIKGYLIKVPCGKCEGCRNDYARRWSVRCYHEGVMHDNFKNCAFITLTFNNNMLYKRKNAWSVDKLAFSQWIKRFRERVRSSYGNDDTQLRFFACGEYGVKGSSHRPHYHLLLYGFNFPDKKIICGAGYPKHLQPHRVGDRVVYNYTSDFLKSCWTPAGSDDSFGFHTISDVNQFTCSYVARYVLKKSCQGLFTNREPVFVNCSRNPGLGASYFDRHYKEMFALGCIKIGKNFTSDIPRYYIDRLKQIDPELYNRYKVDKFHSLVNNFCCDDNSEQLEAKRELLQCKLNLYHRSYEEDLNLHNI